MTNRLRVSLLACALLGALTGIVCGQVPIPPDAPPPVSRELDDGKPAPKLPVPEKKAPLAEKPKDLPKTSPPAPKGPSQSPAGKSADSPLAASSVKTSYETDAWTPRGKVTTTQGGSGTVVKVEPGKFWVLTCKHTVENSGQTEGRLTVHTPDGKGLPGRVAARHPKADLSVIEVAGTASVQAARLASEESYSPGKKVVKVGYPGGGPRHLSRGVIRPGVTHAVGDPSLVSTLATAQSRSGDSGGGLFREEDQSLIGVVWGGRPGEGLWAVRLGEMRDILTRAGVGLTGGGDAVARGEEKPAAILPKEVAPGPRVIESRAGKDGVLRIVGGSPGKRYKVTLEEVE